MKIKLFLCLLKKLIDLYLSLNWKVLPVCRVQRGIVGGRWSTLVMESENIPLRPFWISLQSERSWEQSMAWLWVHMGKIFFLLKLISSLACNFHLMKCVISVPIASSNWESHLKLTLKDEPMLLCSSGRDAPFYDFNNFLVLNFVSFFLNSDYHGWWSETWPHCAFSG